MSKLVKKMELDALGTSLKGVRDMVILSTTKVGSSLDFNFRKSLREKKVRLLMVKNTLARKVLADQGVTIDGVWSGTTLIAWGADSIKELSKAVNSLIQDVEKKDPKAKDKYKVKAAVADGQTISLDAAMKMPTRLEAIGEIVGMLLGPASAIASALTGPGGQLASQVATIAERKEPVAAEPAPTA